MKYNNMNIDLQKRSSISPKKSHKLKRNTNSAKLESLCKVHSLNSEYRIQKMKTLKDKLQNQENMYQLQFKLFSRWCCCHQNKSTNNKSFKNLKSFKNHDDIKLILTHLTHEQKIMKAIRHYQDAQIYFFLSISYYLRTARNDIDHPAKKSLLFIWHLINSNTWNNLFAFLSVAYQMIVFFEPTNRNSLPTNYPETLFVELAILLFLLVDVVLQLTFHFSTRTEASFYFKQLLTTYKVIFKLLFFSIISIDFINQITYYYYCQQSTLRFSRIIRPFLIICYSKYLRRNLKGILQSIQNLIILFFLYFIVFFFWALIGINLLGRLDEDIIIDTNVVDTSNFWHMVNILCILSTMDLYPDLQQHLIQQNQIRMLPSLQFSRLFAFYYIPFMLLFTFLLIPIPLAIVYEGFKQNRVAIQISDQNKRNFALKQCFNCLKEGEIITVKQLHGFYQTLYFHHLNDKELYELIDIVGDEAITFQEFEALYKIIDQISLYSIDRIPPLRLWVRLRIFFEEKYQLRKKLETTKFALILLFLVMVNCSFILASFFIDDQEILDTFDFIDKFFFGIYVIEMLLKFIAFGIYEYFEDGQNTFDFFLVMFQFIFDFILINAISSQFSSTVKVNRIFRLTKIQKVFRVFRAVRTIRILQVLFIGLDIFNKVKDLIVKIIQCIPIVSKFVAILWIVLYVYSSIGVEVFSGNFNESNWVKSRCTERRYSQDQEMVPSIVDWSSCAYTDFGSFQDALFLLLQIFLQANWGWYLFDYTYKIGNYFGTALYFQSFMFFGIFQNALISGLVWEVFNQVNEDNEFQDEQSESAETSNQQIQEIKEETEKQVKFNENDDFNTIFKQIEENIDSNDNHEMRVSWRDNRNFSITKLKTEKNAFTGGTDRMKESENASEHVSIERFSFRPLEELYEDASFQEILGQDKYEKQIVEDVREFFFDQGNQSFGSKGQIGGGKKKNIQRDQYISSMVYNFSQIMRVHCSTSQSVIQILIQMENIVSRQLLVKGSYMKFLFQSKSQWFTMSQEDSWKIIEVGPGPWNQFTGSKQLFQYGQLDEDDWQDTIDRIREISVNHRYSKMAFLNQLVVLNKIQNENPELITGCLLLSVLHSGEQQGKSGFKRKTKQNNSGLNFVKEEEKVEFIRLSQIEGLELTTQLFLTIRENQKNLFKKLEQFIQIREEI